MRSFLLLDRRRLALGLGIGNLLTTCVALIQQTQLWDTSWTWLLVLIPAALAAGCLWLGLREPGSAGDPTPQDPRLREIRESWLEQVGEAAIQEERNRLARDLHDSIKQQLFSIQLGTAAAQARWDHDPEGARKALADVRRCAHAAMVEMQAMLLQLRPQALASVGLVEALREQCEALGYRTGAEVSFEPGEVPPNERLLPGAQEAIFRVAQEALGNVARHARANLVRVRLGMDGQEAFLQVWDDGQGFSRTDGSPGMGLKSMEERVRELRGRLSVASVPGQGTTVEARIPLVAELVAESPLDAELRAETRELWLPAALALMVIGLDRSAGADPRQIGVMTGASLALAILLAVRYVKTPVDLSRRGLDPVSAARLRRASDRSGALLGLVGFWASPWDWHLARGNWTVDTFVAPAGAVICATLAVQHWIRFHRTPPEPRTRPLFSWPAGTWPGIKVILLPLLAGVLVLTLTMIQPAKVGLILTLLVFAAYLLWRDRPLKARKGEVIA